ncbi:MAG: hypothetical protein H7123_08065, partial [Thermoleophilia bacterium]|nr:hypothetical protein [Thermoleophilia bacterium]
MSIAASMPGAPTSTKMVTGWTEMATGSTVGADAVVDADAVIGADAVMWGTLTDTDSDTALLVTRLTIVVMVPPDPGAGVAGGITGIVTVGVTGVEVGGCGACTG